MIWKNIESVLQEQWFSIMFFSIIWQHYTFRIFLLSRTLSCHGFHELNQAQCQDKG